MTYEELTTLYAKLYEHPLIQRETAAAFTAASIVADAIKSLTASVDNLVEVLCDQHPTFTPKAAVSAEVWKPKAVNEHSTGKAGRVHEESYQTPHETTFTRRGPWTPVDLPRVIKTD